MKRSGLFAAIICAAFFGDSAYTQDLSRHLTLDPNVTMGKLDNGVTYYIRYNTRPEKRAEVRLAVNAGSVLEAEGQQGLAHFVEHMAFDGTKNFKKQELTSYMESIGMRFGSGLNASTGFDETVYLLTIPTDSATVVEKAFDILEDWSHQISFDDDEIDKERGVIIEEWRSRRGAEARMLDKQYPILFKGSRYADRLPIGKKAIIETFKHDTLRQFYRGWYRPDLMAVVAVGDFDKSKIEGLIREHFSALPLPAAKRQRPVFDVPDHEEPLFAIATDPEATSSRVAVYYKQEVRPTTTLRDYRRMLLENLYNAMLNNRLNELTKQPDPPFLAAFSQQGKFVRSKEVYALGSVVKNNGFERGLEALLTEAVRLRTYGFTATELEREKKSMLREIEQAFKERDKTESRNFADEYVRNFVDGEPIPGIEGEYELHKQFLPTITLEEVNTLASEWITERNRVVMVNAPEKSDVHVPSQEELSRIFVLVANKKIEPYVDKASSQPLMSNSPEPGTIVDHKAMKDLGITEWRLSNGVRVILKPTDFKNDEVFFTAYSPGGTSLVPDSEFTSALAAASILQEGGLGSFDQITLQKMLAGKIVRVSPYIGELAEGLSGSSAPSDLETLFQMIYMYVTSPRTDSSAFQSFKTRIKGFIQNRNARPETALEDTVQATMSQHHYRRRPISESLLDEMDLQSAMKIYRDRFADASDFTFIFVGAFAPAQLEPLVKTYLGGLPSLGRNESWKDVGITTPTGSIAKVVSKGIEPKSQVQMVFTGPFDWSPAERYVMNSLMNVLQIKLREVVREERSGTYNLTVAGSPSHYPRSEYRIAIAFGCAPERVDELTKVALEQVDSLKHVGIGQDYVAKVQEIQRRERETHLKENRFWLNTLQFYYDNDEDPMQLLRFDELVEGLSRDAIQEAAQKYFDMENYARFVLYPAHREQ